MKDGWNGLDCWGWKITGFQKWHWTGMLRVGEECGNYGIVDAISMT